MKDKILGRGVIRAGEGTITIGEETLRAGQKFLVPSHPLTNFEIQKCYQNEPKFNGVYSRNNLLKLRNGPYVINLGEYKTIGTRWIVLYVNGNNGSACYDATYFDSIGVEYIPKENKKIIGN